MTWEIVSAIVKWLVPAVLGGIVTWCITYVKMKTKRNTAVEDGLQCLLRADIIHMNDKCIDRGYCPIYAKEALEREYAAYHALGGNDVATALYHNMMALPVEPPAAGKE
ncbi:MAG: hypothetical protein IJX53_00790 [Clostridia bacterium]|nr:hypothetical protein [Clostridia bacterium]